MEFIGKARMEVGNLILSKRIAKIKRKVYYSNISEVKSIGIVWDASKTQDFPYLSKFYRRMLDRNIKVKIIGYYPGKELPDQYTALRYLSCIRKREIKFFNIPVSTETDYFIKNRFDVLIDINFENKFPLYYISSLSVSGFKVGLYDSVSGTSIFDLMIELKNPVSVENYLDEVVRYLEMINSGSTST